MNPALLLSAFTLGLFGSLHCVGMCGPLMLSVPGSGRFTNLVLYQGGRILTYALLGFVFGWLGWGARLWNFQGSLAVISGGLLVAVALYRIDPARIIHQLPVVGRIHLGMRRWIGSRYSAHPHGLRFGLGVLNGLLPCGLVYLAIVGAANASGPGAGAVFMVAFGTGTLPLLVSSLYLGGRLRGKISGKLAWWTPVITLVAGIILIWRGGGLLVPAEFADFRMLTFPVMCQ